MASKQDLSSEPAIPDHSGSWRTWLWSTGSSITTRNLTIGPFEGTSAKARCVVFLLYRALLVAGIGLSLAKPAVASVSPATSEVVVQETVARRKAAEKAPRKVEDKGAQNEEASALGEEFWKGVDLARGSTELILKKILDGDPMNLSALECLAKTLAENDDYSRALLVLEKLEVLQPNEMEWKYMRAEAYDMDGKSQLAKQIFEEILKVEPFSSRALQGLVLAMDQLEEFDSALKILEETWTKAKQENNRVEARNFGMLIGQLYTFKGRMQEALQHYKGMLDEDASDYRPYLCQGIIYSVLGETDMANERFETFEKLCPKDLPDREFLNGLMSRARKEGQKIYELKKKKNARNVVKGWKGS
eukprot:c12453_g1_i1 orf=384-1466(+)